MNRSVNQINIAMLDFMLKMTTDRIMPYDTAINNLHQIPLFLCYFWTTVKL